MDSAVNFKLMADIADFQRQMQAAKDSFGGSMAAMDTSMQSVKAGLNSMAQAEQARASVFSKTWAETKRLLDIAKKSADDTAESLAQIKIDPNALRIPPEALQNLKTWQEQSAAAIGAGAAVGWDKAKSAWDEFKSYSERTIVIWGVALATGIAAAALSAVYALYKSIDFIWGLFTGESYKSANIDALIAMNKEVETLQKSLPLTAVGASALNDALKQQGISASDYATTLNAVDTAVRGNGDELDRLGVKYKDTQGKVLDTNTILHNASDVLATYKEGWDRTSAAQAIGLGSEEAIHAALEVTAEKTQEAKDRLVSYGLVIGEGTQEAVANYQTSMRLFQLESDRTSQGFKRAWADQIMPLLTDLSDFFRDGFPTAVMAFRYSMATVTSLFYGLKTVLYIVLESLAGVLEGLGTGVVALVSAVSKALSGDFSGAKAELVNGWEKAQVRLAQIGSNIVAQARHDSAAMALAWGADSLGANSTPNARPPAAGKPWEAKPKDEPEVTDKELAQMQALLLAENEHIAVMQKQATQMETLTHSQELLEKLKVISTAGYSAEALAVRALYMARLQDGIAMELAAAARAADAAALKKYNDATQGNIEKLKEEADSQNLTAAQVQKITALRTIDKAAADAIFKTKTDELGITQSILAATPQMVEQILLKAKADKEETAGLLDKITVQKLTIQYDQEIAKLKADSVIYLDSTAKELANLDLEAKRRKAIIATITDEGEAIKANAKYNEWYQASLDKINADKLNGIWQTVDQTAHDTFTNIFQGGQDAFTKLANTLKSTLLDLLYQMTVKKWIFEIFANVTGAGSAGGAAISALSGGGSAASGASGLSSIYSLGSKGYNYISSLFGGGGAISTAAPAVSASSFASTGAAMGGTEIGGAAGIGSGTTLGGAGASSGASAGFAGIPVVGWIIMGMMASNAAFDQGFRADGKANIGSGYSVNDGSMLGPNSMLNFADHIGQALGLSPKLAGIFSGAPLGAQAMYSLLGGYQLSPAGTFITGSVGGTGNSLQSRTDVSEDHRGPLGIGSFTTTNSSYAQLDSGTAGYIDAAIKSVQASVKTFGSAIGLTSDTVDSFTKNIEVNIAGLNATDAKAAIDKAIDGFMNDMVTAAFGSQISALAVDGETSSQTLARIATQFLTVNDALGLFGAKLLAVGINGATAADSLVKMMGGLQNFQALTADFAKNYLTADQQRKATLNNIASTMQGAGVNVTADQIGGMTRADVAAYVASLDLTTAAGQKAYAAVMSVEGAFASLTPTLDAVGQAAAAAAAQNNALMQNALANYGTSQEQRDFAIAQIQDGLKTGGINLTADQIGNANRKDARDLYNYYATQHTASGDAAAHAILTQADAFAKLTAGANTATAAIGGGGGGGGGGTNNLTSAFQSLTDAIFKEVERIRGIVTGADGVLGFNELQAKFATTTAAARAGSQDAASALPGISQAMLAMADTNMHTLVELQRFRALTANSLALTGGILATTYGLSIPQFAVGTNNIPHDMIAMLHKGEAVVPAAYNPATGGGSGGNQSDLIEALTVGLKGVQDELAEARKELAKISDNSRDSRYFHGKWDQSGMPPARAKL